MTFDVEESTAPALFQYTQHGLSIFVVVLMFLFLFSFREPYVPIA
jgi:hypothetical protein